MCVAGVLYVRVYVRVCVRVYVFIYGGKRGWTYMSAISRAAASRARTPLGSWGSAMCRRIILPSGASPFAIHGSGIPLGWRACTTTLSASAATAATQTSAKTAATKIFIMFFHATSARPRRPGGGAVASPTGMSGVDTQCPLNNAHCPGSTDSHSSSPLQPMLCLRHHL